MSLFFVNTEPRRHPERDSWMFLAEDGEGRKVIVDITSEVVDDKGLEAAKDVAIDKYSAGGWTEPGANLPRRVQVTTSDFT